MVISVKQTIKIFISLVLLVAGFLLLRSAYTLFYKAAYPLGYNELVEEYCQRFDLPENLAYAVIHTESGFDPMAKSGVGARGLMQIMPDTFEWARYRLGEGEERSYTELHEPEVNLKYGIATLSLLVQEFGDSNEALAAYHAGRGSVNKWLQNEKYSTDGETLSEIPFKDTRAYVNKVMQTRIIYQNLYNL